MYNFKEIEKEILNYWKNYKIIENLREKNKKGKPFYFLQGPPYTSGRLHLGQALNNSLKDAVLRYKRFQGFDVWDRAGYDMHGLPTSKKVMAKLNLKSKEEIEKYGVDKFNKECMDFSLEMAKQMDEDLKNMGISLNFEDPYYPIKDEFIESEWFLVKEADKKKRLYEGEKTLTWCAHCETGLAKHECHYKNITDKSVFVKLKIKDTNENLIIWTTTPWTLAFNLAVMVNPELTYVKIEVNNEKWILAKDLLEKVLEETLQLDYKILEEIKGKDLEGVEYIHPWFNEIKDFKELKKKHPKLHTVVLSKEYVTTEAGSGLVHCAPGCGPEDYEVGYENNLPPYNNIDETGVFPETMGKFSNLKAKVDDDKFIEALGNSLIKIVSYKHDYAHHERCDKPVIFRKTKQWFFKVEDLKEEMLSHNKKVHWVPETMGNSFTSWLENLRDNSITRQIHWGTPVPIWKCPKCKDYTVIGSKKELEKLAGKAPENLHIPWIDEIKIPCKCGYKKRRIPDVLDVWVDAGTVSWNCLYYPERTDLFQKYFPADFILEGTDQIRGWFNLLLITSMIAFDKPSYKSVYVHSMISDVEGVKMSKSLGNVISPYELIEKHGTDTMRAYTSSVDPGMDINFSWDELRLRYKNLSILWNLHEYLIEYSKAFKVTPKYFDNPKELEEKYILSRLNSTIKKVTECFEFYSLNEIQKNLESLILDLSREYIQLTREKINKNPQLVIDTIYTILLETLKLTSCTTPFIAEKIHLNLKKEFKLKENSIFNYSWPKTNSKLINKEIENEFTLANEIIQTGLSCREKIKLGVRWPLNTLTIVSTNPDLEHTLENLDYLIKSKLNIKEINLEKTSTKTKTIVVPNKNKIGKDFKKDSIIILSKLNKENLKEIEEKNETVVKDFKLTRDHFDISYKIPGNLISSNFSQGLIILDKELTKELEEEGFSRELVRRIQDIRKDEGLKKQDKVKISISTKLNLSNYKNYLKEKVGAQKLEFSNKNLGKQYNFKIRDEEFLINMAKI